MSKPSASGRRLKGNDGRYHRHNLGGGSALKAVTRRRRAAASRQLGHPAAYWAQYRKAIRQVMEMENREGTA